MMKNEKQAYMAPTTDILELRVESQLLQASPLDYFYGEEGAAGRKLEEDGEYDYSF